MKTFTINDIRSWGPCYDPSRYLPEDWSGNALDMLAINEIPPENRLWVILRPELIDKRTLQLIACDIAESVLPIWFKYAKRDKHYNTPAWAIEIKRRHIDGYATDGELLDACDAACDAYAAACDARAAAACDARAADAAVAAYAAVAATAHAVRNAAHAHEAVRDAAASAAVRDAAQRVKNIEIIKKHLK